MNKDRRKTIAAIRQRLSDIRVDIIDLAGKVEGVASDEREYYDNMPEGLQGSEKGSDADEVASALEEAHQALEELLESTLDDVDGQLATAIGE